MKQKNNYIKNILVIFIILISLLSISIVFAQESDMTETFDGDSLDGWELSDQAIIKDGALYISPGNFAVKEGLFSFDSLDVKINSDGTGVIFIRFLMDDESDYAIICFADRIILEKVTQGSPEEIGSYEGSLNNNSWTDIGIAIDSGKIDVSLDSTIIIQATDEEPLSNGRIGFFVEGESTVSFDDLTLTGLISINSSGDDNSSGGEEPLEGAESTDDTVTTDDTDITNDVVTTDDSNSTQEQAETTNTETTPSTFTLTSFLSDLSSSQSSTFELSTFIINLGLSVLLSFILSRVYVHWGSSLSNRRRFAANFMLITVTTTFIILVVRSSVALSLGLVGALSIVRFRAAIKEPEELAYLFFAISIGIGLGDNQRLITILALSFAILTMGILRFFRGRQADFNLHISVRSNNPEKVELETVMDTLSPHCSQLKLLRFDDSKTTIECSFLAEFKNIEKLKSAKTAIRALSESIEVTFLDNKGIW